VGATLPRITWQVYKIIFSFKSLQDEMAHMEGSGGKTG